MTETRKLAAILVADVVGYSRLAGSDEDRTLARLRGLRSDLIDPAIDAHHGRVVKRTGDGILIEFRSVVDAVRCAIEVQNGLIERNAGLPPERRIEFRVGIHLGDVVEESDGDLMGDGVNIAARLEGIANPGAICLSEDAYRQVKGRLDLAVSDLGPIQLKNIADPVRVYSLEVGKPAQVRATTPAAPKQRSVFVLPAAGLVALAVFAAGIWLAVRPASGPEVSATTPRLSIVVLPFANLSGDPGQDYLADVLTEGLTTGLSRISGTFVIARSTAFTYKGKPVDVKQVGKDLGVRYVLEGSEQHSGNQVRVNAQLIDAETGAHLWADQFDADRTDLLQMQDEIVTRIARAMQIQLVAVDAARVTRTRPGNLDAEDLALRCEAGEYNSPPGSAEHTAAFDLCDRALHIDNGNVFALTGMTLRYITPVVEAQSSDPQADIGRANELVSRALAIDPNFYFCSLRQSLCPHGARPHPRGGRRGGTQPRSQPQFYRRLPCPLLCKQHSGPAGSCLGACRQSDSPQSARPAPSHLISHEGMGLFHEATGRSGHRMASAGRRRRCFHRTHTRRGACVDRATDRRPRNAQTLPCGQRRHQQDHRPTEKAAVVVGRQYDVGGLQRAALRGPAQSGDAGGMSAGQPGGID